MDKMHWIVCIEQGRMAIISLALQLANPVLDKPFIPPSYSSNFFTT